MTTGILVATAIWHLLAFWHFTIHPARTLARTTESGASSQISVELFRFLGSINAAFVVLALASIPAPARAIFASLAVANLSQLVIDLRVRRMGLARGVFFQQVMVGDALFTGANVAGLLFL